MKLLQITTVIALAAGLASAAWGAETKKQIVFVHGKASHGYGGHAYGPAFRMLARMLNENVPAVNAVVVQDDQDLAGWTRPTPSCSAATAADWSRRSATGWSR